MQASVLYALQSGVDGEHLSDLGDAFGSVRALALVVEAAELIVGQATERGRQLESAVMGANSRNGC